MRSLAVDYGPSGVRVNTVCPGWVVTPMSEPLLQNWSAEQETSFEDALRRITDVIPLRRAAKPQEIAATSLFLVSDEASFVSGSVLVAGGGQAPSTSERSPSCRAVLARQCRRGLMPMLPCGSLMTTRWCIQPAQRALDGNR
jgi:hypothetical protein